ncbi:DEAD/DEAH box helicase [Paraperlucidibaca wandonensis]|jgi:ATP-dependent RNA helicase RhlE|uniref:DEAD/DEAH box helicase n=1 Tax=Paraperlucidibaca wandonensis TaxID=1268273 RepID=A0ABW3HIE9_9GAMM|nr:DEAD/DEAH box helicase [Paraperlucidibaca sp.]MBQ0722898.1 DEAD/DEAH box helicase [Paraperlucidibaca sp.]MBQ0841602.1 DEAD/DEAH box helicase [Paraperlucidibaca sp.]|tara:strand:+ start:3946 stop:5307 length:1362 start_codon:yes stop_codon:yes gene_type:complete
MSFADLGLMPELLQALEAVGYTTPTPIQRDAIPVVLAGRDLLAAAQTGTGKTAGFTLPMLQLLSSRHAMHPSTRHRPRALILTPTRELAAQVEESVSTYGKQLSLNSMVMFGGVGMQPQVTKLRGKVDILVATPGRLLDHVGQGTLDLGGIELFVLDEADRMLDMGFIRDIRRVLAILPKQRQNLLFSATFADEIRNLANSLLKDPATVEVTPRNTTVERIEQTIYPVDREAKRQLLEKLILDGEWSQVLVFTRTKHGANRLADQLDKNGIAAMAIHGNKSQTAREKALREFKSNRLRVLVATDIAARGIDIDSLPYVVNYELPQVAEDYVHRIGRTGRAGAGGEAVSLVCVDELKLLADIERTIKQKLNRVIVPGFEPDPNAKPEPLRKAPPPRGPRRDKPARAADQVRRDQPSQRRRSSGNGPAAGAAPAPSSRPTSRPSSRPSSGSKPSR